MRGKRKGICLGLAVMLVLGILGSTALAQGRPTSVVSTDVISFVQGAINLEYEKVLNPGMSLYATPFLGLGGGANAGYKYFLPDKFTIEGALGLAYTTGGGFAPVYGINVGYAF